MIFEKHEPAIINNENFSFYSIDDETAKWRFCTPPDCLIRLNRYLIEKDSIVQFINMLISNYDVLSCVYIPENTEYFSKVQKLIRIKNFQNNGWKQDTTNYNLFIKKIDNLAEDEMKLLYDFYIRDLFIFANKGMDFSNINNILCDLNFLNFPLKFEEFGFTEQALKSIERYQIATINILKFYIETEANKQRSIFTCYSPWKL